MIDHLPISEVAYNSLPQAVRDWIVQDLKWKREDIFSYHVKYGSPILVTVSNMQGKRKQLKFVDLGNGSWQKA